MPRVSAFKCAKCGVHRWGQYADPSPDGLICNDACSRQPDPVERCRCMGCCGNCDDGACEFMRGFRREYKASSTISRTPPQMKRPGWG